MTRYYMENEFSENFTFQMYYNKDIYKSLHQKKKSGACRGGGGGIKSTDHRPTDHRPLTHRPTNLKITDPTDKTLFQRLDRWRIYSFYRTQPGRCKAILRSIIYLMDKYLCKIFIYPRKFFIFSYLQKKKTKLFCKRHREDLIMFIFRFKLNCCTPSQIYHSFFLRMEISMRTNVFFT